MRAKEPVKYQGKILVPFCIESSLSGVGKSFSPGERLWYRRAFTIPAGWSSKKILLHFEAVDWKTQVWVNGSLAGSHQGCYDAFSFDITPYVKPGTKQDIVVAVEDPTSTGSQPRGKQLLNPSGIWYTPVSGIWQTVWLEAVPKETFIEDIRITTDPGRSSLSVLPFLHQPHLNTFRVLATIGAGGKTLVTDTLSPEKVSEIRFHHPELWSPGHPFLYDLNLQLIDASGKVTDEVRSYFGMRKISLGEADGHVVLMLNDRLLFQYGPLDQGWWPDGLYTPPGDEAMKHDLEMTKAMGFNMIRKHVKVENRRWYYWCDKMGILVWQDMPSGMAVMDIGNHERPLEVERVRPGGEDLN